MNTIQTAIAIITLVGSVGGGIYALDARYVPMSEYRDFQWAYLKDQLRQLREDKERGVPGADRDYEELLDLFCRKYPADRECRNE